MRFAATLRFLAALVATNLRAAYAHRGAFWLQTTLMIVNDAVYFTVWWIFFHRFPEVAGWRVADMMALQGLVAGSIGLAWVVAGGARNLARTISEGDLDVFLTRPKPVVLQAVSSTTIASGLGDLAYGVAMTTASGLVRPETVPILVVGAVCAAVAFLSFAVIVHSLAFWAGDTNTLTRQAQDWLATVSQYPESIFGPGLRAVLYGLLPAGLVGWLPVSLLRDFAWTRFATLVGATAVAAALALYVFHRGLVRYASGSRVRVGI